MQFPQRKVRAEVVTFHVAEIMRHHERTNFGRMHIAALHRARRRVALHVATSMTTVSRIAVNFAAAIPP